MANHKRKRPKNRRAGCLMCKPWKVNGAKSSGMYGDGSPLKPSEQRRVQIGKEER